MAEETLVVTDVNTASKNDGKKAAKGRKKEEKQTLKSVLTKMVPYASFPYADHILR